MKYSRALAVSGFIGLASLVSCMKQGQSSQEQKPIVENPVLNDTRYLADKDSLFALLASNPPHYDRPSYFHALANSYKYHLRPVKSAIDLKREKGSFAQDYNDFISDIYHNLQRDQDHLHEEIPNEREILTRAQSIGERLNPGANVAINLIKQGYHESLAEVQELSNLTQGFSDQLRLDTRIGSVPYIPGHSESLWKLEDRRIQDYLVSIKKNAVKLGTLSLMNARFARNFAKTHHYEDYTRSLEVELIESLYKEANHQAENWLNLDPILPILVPRHVGRTLAEEISHDNQHREWFLVQALCDRALLVFDNNSVFRKKVMEINPRYYNLSKIPAQRCLEMGRIIARENHFDDLTAKLNTVQPN